MDKKELLKEIKLKGKFNGFEKGSVEFNRLALELNFFEENRGMYYSVNRFIVDKDKFEKNKINSYIFYLLDICSELPDFNNFLILRKDWFPTRFSAPDVDMDFEDNRAVQLHCEDLYNDRFIYIGTFGTWRVKNSIQDAVKFNNFILPGRTIADTATTLSKLVNRFPKDDSFEAHVDNEEFRSLISEFPEVTNILNDAKLLVGQIKNTGKHAGGVIICDVPINQVCPYFLVEEKIDMKKTGRWIRVSQFNDKDCESLGLLKVDILGVKTLESMHVTLDLIKSRHGIELDLNKIDVHNAEENKLVFELFHTGLTGGIFQFEEPNNTKFMQSMRPTTFGDIVAGNALYRPGPKDNGYTDEYCRRKNNNTLAKPPHPALEELLSDTYGLWVYQEHLMKGSGILAGFNSTEQDELRRIIGKKDLAKLPVMKEKFVSRCISNGVIDQRTAEIIWDQFEKFGNYAFNKSHAVSYSVMAYQTAWLKRYFPSEFYAGTMTRELNGASSVDDEKCKIKTYETEARKFGIGFLEPDVNLSKKFYNIEKIDGTDYLRKPMGYLKGIGEALEYEIIKNQPYNSFEEFYTKNSKALNISTIDTIISSGALNSFGDNEYLISEYNRCKEIVEASKKANSGKRRDVKLHVPRLNGLF